jgi:hypothetical protein
MAYTSDQLLARLGAVSGTLGLIGKQLKDSRMDARKQEVLAKYNQPGVYTNKDGTNKTPQEIAQTVQPDIMWLNSNGFEKEGQTLGQMYVDNAKRQDLEAKNRTFMDIQDKVDYNKFNDATMNQPGNAFQRFDFSTIKPKEEKPMFTKYGQKFTLGEDGKHYVTQQVLNKMTGEVIALEPELYDPVKHSEVTSNSTSIRNFDTSGTWSMGETDADGNPIIINSKSGEVRKTTATKTQTDPIKSLIKKKLQETESFKKDPKRP